MTADQSKFAGNNSQHQAAAPNFAPGPNLTKFDADPGSLTAPTGCSFKFTFARRLVGFARRRQLCRWLLGGRRGGFVGSAASGPHRLSARCRRGRILASRLGEFMQVVVAGAAVAATAKSSS